MHRVLKCKKNSLTLTCYLLDQGKMKKCEDWGNKQKARLEDAIKNHIDKLNINCEKDIAKKND